MQRPMVPVLLFITLLLAGLPLSAGSALAECSDLTVHLTGPPAAAPSGVVGNLLTTVIGNEGDQAPAGSYSVGFYISGDKTVTTGDLLLTGGREFVAAGPLPGNESTLDIYDGMQLPGSLTPGQYYLGVIVDEMDYNGDCSFEDNTFSYPITVVDDCADLHIKITAPPVAGTGRDISNLMTMDVGNQGDMDAGPFLVRYYLTDRDADYLLGETRVEKTIGPGNDVILSSLSGIVVPEDTPPGDYELIAVVDDNGDIDECNEENNFHQLPMRIETGCPDPTVELSGPATAEPGQSVGELLDVVLKNLGTAVDDPYIIDFLLSGDAVVTAADPRLEGAPLTGPPLVAGAVLSLETGAVLSIPADTEPGNYYLGLIVDVFNNVDECDEGNNIAAFPIEIVDPCPDLFMVLENPDENNPEAPITAEPGDNIGPLFVPTAKNTGDGNATSFVVHFYISKTPSVTEESIFAGATEISAIFAEHSISLFTGPTFFLEDDFPPGEYFLVATADEAGDVEECDEENNVQALPITIEKVCPDLAVDINAPVSNAAAPFTAFPEQDISGDLAVLLENRGNEDAGFFMAGFYLSADEEIDFRDSLLIGGRLFESGLPAGDDLDLTPLSLTIPGSTPPGDYFLGVTVDELKVLGDCDLENNTALIPVRINEGQCSTPDLLAEFDDFTLERVENRVNGSVSVTVHNSGLTPVQDAAVQAFMSEDPFIELLDTFLPGAAQNTGPLFPGESITLEMPASFTLGEDVPLSDRYYLGVVADAERMVEECNELNNSAGAFLCERPMIDDNIRLYLPWVAAEGDPAASPVSLELDLIPWESGGAFELVKQTALSPDKGGDLCDRILLTGGGLMEIPYIRFVLDGVITLSAELQQVAGGDATVFEIVHVEILP